MFALGQILWRLHQSEEAAKVIIECLNMRKLLLGNDHPDIGTTLDRLGTIYSDLKKLQ